MDHIPVLLEPILEMAKSMPLPPSFYFDGTFGRGGHARALMDLFPSMKIMALDQDSAAIECAERDFAADIAQGRMKVVRANFSSVEEWREHAEDFHGGHGFDLVLLDLGVSSPQLDQGERGFSFYHDGPLDMRMDQRDGITAEIILNEWDSDDLAEMFQALGEVRRPYRVVEAIINERREKPFKSTIQLASLIERSDGWRKKGFHPATQYFMALRLQVNRELDVITDVIPKMIDLLADQGRFMVITFHSLEDRIVKYAFKDQLEHGFLVNKKVIQPHWNEAKKNPRARSAKLRVFQKGEKNESK